MPSAPHPSHLYLVPERACEPESRTVDTPSHLQPLYQRLADGMPSARDREAAADWLAHQLEEGAGEADEMIPNDPAACVEWMQASAKAVLAEYQQYLQERREGASRRYFKNRSHALFFLRQVAPTKLVDGAWLYGLCEGAANPRLRGLVTTYVEELGEGDPAKNHVLLYRHLLARYGLDAQGDLDDHLYEQGLVQCALGWNAERFLPEIVGFNLGYEQLPLHLLITAYELKELGLDPYYFTLHVTVDNSDTGHAWRACQAAAELAPRFGQARDYWARVKAGARLGNCGWGTLDVIASFDLDREVQRILARKAVAGQGAHSHLCRIDGRLINDWLAAPAEMPAFLQALQRTGWIERHKPAERSRFWSLLQGDRAPMWGVFSAYELQVLRDWMEGDRPQDAGQGVKGPVRQLAGHARSAPGKGHTVAPSTVVADLDLVAFRERIRSAKGAERQELLLKAMSPALHWTPAGLEATRMFVSAL